MTQYKEKYSFKKHLKQKRYINSLKDAEQGMLPKPFGSHYPIALVFPNKYELGMANLGVQTVYRIIQRHPGFSCERFFYPDLISVENQRKLNEFKIIFFSISYELDLFNFIHILRSSAIEIMSEKRGKNDPIICVGGHVVTLNRFPIYDFVDIFFHGEAEVYLNDLLDTLATNNFSVNTILKEYIPFKPGVEITSSAAKRFGLDYPFELNDVDSPNFADIDREFVNDISHQHCHTEIFTPNTEFGNSFSIELTRGCPFPCKFCYTGNVLKPFRVCLPDTIVEQINIGRQYTDKFGLISAAVNKYPYIEQICEYLLKNILKVSFSSFRIEDISPIIYEVLAASGQTTLTIAPETGDEELRKKIGKPINNEKILLKIGEMAQQLSKHREIQQRYDLKLYFMIGLPDETSENRRSIASLIKTIKSSLTFNLKTNHVFHITANINIFIPKRRTPFQNASFYDIHSLKKILEETISELRKVEGIIIKAPSVREAANQYILSNKIEEARNLLLKQGFV